MEIVVTVYSDLMLDTPGLSLVQRMENARQTIAPQQKQVVDFISKEYPALVTTKSVVTPTVIVYLDKEFDKALLNQLLSDLVGLSCVKSAECTGMYK